MADLNEYNATCRLVTDPNLQYTGEGQAVARFRLAVNGPTPKGGGEAETMFLSATAWGKLAENVSQYLRKGQRAAVSGRLRLNSWTTKDGDRRERIELMLRNVVFLEPKSSGERDGKDVATPPKPGADEEAPF